MLYDEPILFFRGLTIYRDFSDDRTFYFTPPEVPRIARSVEGGGTDYALRLVLYRPDPNAPAPEGFENGGGFLNLDTDLHVSDELIEEAEEEIRRRFGGNANLVPIPFMDGTVELVLLGTSRGEEGQPFVRKIAGSTVPSLYGHQRAAFSVVLDRDGAALMQQVIEAGGATMALAIYHLTYAGIGPAYNLKITVNYERVLEHMDLRLNAAVSAGNSNSSFVGRAGFHLLMEELKENRAILVEEVDPIPGENGRAETNQERINEIIGNLMGSTWFKPTLGQASQITNLGAGSGAQTDTRSNDDDDDDDSDSDNGSQSGGSQSGGGQSSGNQNGGNTAEGGTEETPSENQARLPDASWTVNRRQPEPLPEGHDVRLRPDTEGTRETLIVSGANARARVDGQDVALDGNRLQVEVAAGSRKNVEVRWPGRQVEPQTVEPFWLFFNFDHPENQPQIDSYVAGNPNPDDARFTGASQTRGGSERGVDALRAWLDALPHNRLVLRAYASYEQDDSDETHNMDLSRRRLEVANRLIRRLFPNRFDLSDAQPQGHGPARQGNVETLTPGGGPDDNHGSKPEHRTVLIKLADRGEDEEETTESMLQGTLSRDTVPAPGPGPGPAPGPAPGGEVEEEEDPTKVEASFEVNFEMIRRQERITATYELNSRKARTREIHPQGQLILDTRNPEQYILEADGAVEFFQWLDLAASTTARWELDGIDSIRIQLRYGPRDDGSFIRSGEMILSPDQETDEWRVGILRENDEDDRKPVYWYEYRVTINYLADVALGDQQGAVSSVGVPGADAEGWIRDTARNLVIHPRDVTPAMTINLASGVMRFDLLERVQLTLSYGPHRQNLTLSPETPEHRLVIRPEPGMADQQLRTEGTLFYRDGARIPLPEQQWTPQELIVINEPRDNILRVQMLMADPMDAYEKIHVRLRYVHANRTVEQDFELTEHAQMEVWSVRLEDPDQRDWSYQTTAIKRSGDIDTIDWTPGEDSQLILGVKAVDVIPVQVTWLMVPPAAGLLAVKVDMEYDDDANDLHWPHSELIREGHGGSFIWSIPIRDPAKRQYRYRVTQFTESGMDEGPWKESSEQSLVLLPGA